MKTIFKEEGFPLDIRKTYLAMIEGSHGSAMFRNLFVMREDGPHDVINDGDLACAFYASLVLYSCGLTNGGVHTTVDETIRDMMESGWYEVKEKQVGAVVVWGLKLSDTDGLMHRHIGFCVGEVLAVSTNSKRRSPQIHLLEGLLTETGEPRGVQAYYMHPSLVAE